jgi:hypothetical protein
MHVFGFFRHDDHPTSLHAGLLAAHGLASFDEPVTYIRIIGEGKLPIRVSEGTVHQTLQAIECPITQFGSFETLCKEARGLANGRRHVLLDLPAYARMFLSRERAIDIPIALLSLPTSAAPGHEDRSGPLAAYPRTDQGHIFPQQASFQWILRCHQLGRSSLINMSSQASIASALQPPFLREHRVLPYEVPAMSNAQWSSLRVGAPLSSVYRASRVLAWALMLTLWETASCVPAGASTSHNWFPIAQTRMQGRRKPIHLMRLLPRKLRALNYRASL